MHYSESVQTESNPPNIQHCENSNKLTDSAPERKIIKSDTCFELWGKTDPYKSLCCHMIDAGCCAKAYLESPALTAVTEYLAKQWDCSAEEAICFTSYLVAMHDIGKATPQFQMQSEEQFNRLKNTEVREIFPDHKLNPVRHEFLSQKIAGRIWKGWGADKRLYSAYSCILSLHHQRTDQSERKKPIVHEEWQRLQDELEKKIRGVFSVPEALPKAGNMDPLCMLLTGILILCDWVASSGPFDVLPDWSDQYEKKSSETARKAMKQYGLTEDHRMKGITSFQSMWPEITMPRNIQKRMEELDVLAPLTIIEAPMGEGKTEAALYFAEKAAEASDKRGVYVALPTQATSNQMFERVSKLLEKRNHSHARLMHGTAFLMKDNHEKIQSEDASEAEKWLGSARMALLDENGVGTVDQAMGAVLMARFSALRLLGLADKALVIDELHAYDAYMSRIIESLLRWCRSLRIPVILLSATLQDSQRIRYMSCYTDANALNELDQHYPLITQVRDDCSVAQIRAEASMTTEYVFSPLRFGQDENLIADFAVNKIRQGGCYCIIVNTVRMAQKVYSALMQIRDQDTEVRLFHARFPMKKRDEIEKRCLLEFGRNSGNQRPGKAVLVATQVVEQSLDIDFDGMISELAPIDLLLQRAGRVHRHRERIRPEGLETPAIHVILPSGEDAQDLDKRYGLSGFVYDPFLLNNTELLLEAEKVIHVPEDVRSVISQVYEHVTETNMEAWNKRTFNAQLFSANADWASFPPPSPELFFPTQSHPEFENMNVDDGFEPAGRAATRIGDPTFRIAFVEPELLEKAKNGYLSKEQQKEILLSSVSLHLNAEIETGLKASGLFQIRKGVLWGCYLVGNSRAITIGGKELINDPVLGVYWKE